MEQYIDIPAVRIGPMADTADHAQLAPSISRELRNCWFKEGYADIRPTWGNSGLTDPAPGDGCLGSGYFTSDSGEITYITITWDQATGVPDGWGDETPRDDVAPDSVVLVIPWKNGAFIVPSRPPGYYTNGESGPILYANTDGISRINADQPDAPNVEEHTEAGNVMPGVYSYVVQWENVATGILSPASEPTQITVGLNEEDAQGPSAGPVVSVESGGNIDKGSRLYSVAFYNPSTGRETALGTATTAIITEDNSKVVLTGVPVPKNTTEWPQKRLYVSDAAGAFRRLATLSATTTSYVDDGSVSPGDEHVTTGTSVKITWAENTAPLAGSSWKMRVYRSSGGGGYQFLGYMEGGQFIDTYETAEEAPGGGTLLETITQVPWCNHACASVDGIVAWACDKETPAPFKVYVSSSPDQPLSVGEEYDIDPRYGPITALARCGENFLVFTARSIQAITPTSGRATVITAGMGCIGPRAWCETPHGIAFASIYGPAFLPRCTGDPRYVGPDPEQFALRDLWAEMFSTDNGRTTQTIDIAQYKVRCLHVPEIPAVLWFFQRAKWPADTSILPYTFDTAIMWEYGRRDERLTVHDLLCVQDVLLTPEGTPRPLCWLWPGGWKRIFGKDVTEEIVQYTGLSSDGHAVSGFPAEQIPSQGDVLYVSSGTGQMTGDVQRMVDHVVVSVGCGGIVITAGEPVLGEDSTVWLNGFPWVVDIGPIVPAEPELVKRWTRISVETAQ